MTKQVLGATALALLIGVSTFTLNTALAQNGGDARSNDREMQKKLDQRELTPIRPIRRVGEENWPVAKDAKDQPAKGETTGQSAQTDTKKEEPAKQEIKQDTAKQDSKQEPVKQDTAKQDDAAKPEQKQDTAKQDVKQDTPTPAAKPDVKPQDTAQNKDAAPDKKTDKGFASIRLGTDEGGRVAVNEAQERQISSALRKQRVDTVNVKVSVGSVAPANVRLVAVSSDVVDVLPQFRGYNYFATREEIVIVAPSTKKVVAMIPLKLTATASRPSEERTTQTETRRTETPRAESKTAAKPAVKERTATVGRGDGVPSREEILAGPVARGPAGATVTRSYRSYQYYEPEDDDVVIVERRRPRFFRMW